MKKIIIVFILLIFCGTVFSISPTDKQFTKTFTVNPDKSISVLPALLAVNGIVSGNYHVLATLEAGAPGYHDVSIAGHF